MEVEGSKMPPDGSKTAPDACKNVRRQLKRPPPGFGNGSRECQDRQRALKWPERVPIRRQARSNIARRGCQECRQRLPR
eukprot:4120699-Pyramimonas_sp.AAC.1